MSENAVELATGYVSLAISTEGMGKKILTAFSGADKAGAQAGKSSGKAFSKSFGSGAAESQDDLAAAAKRAGDAAEAAAGKAKAAYAARDAQARKLKIAELQLAEIQEGGKATASQLATAQDKVATAANRLQQAEGKVVVESSRLKNAQADAARAMGQTERAAKDSADGVVKSYSGLGGRLKGAFSGLGRGLSSTLRGAGEDGGRRFGDGFRDQVKTRGKSIASSIGGSILGPLAAVFAGTQIISLVRNSIGEARESQKVGAATTQIVKATGGAAQVSARQVGDLTTAISLKTGVDDEAIQSGANLLLTFKNVRNEAGEGANVFDRANQAAVDLSKAGFGSITGSSKMLGKALNDPVKGISALSRAGVTFTDQQKEQVKALVATGDVLGAQKVILGEVEGQVGGVAAASTTASEKAAVGWGNLKEQLGTVLLPTLDRVSTFFTTKGIPAISSFVSFVSDKGGPAVDRLRGYLVPVVDRTKAFVGEMRAGVGTGGQFVSFLTLAGSAISTIVRVGTGAVSFVVRYRDVLIPLGATLGVIALGLRAVALQQTIMAAGGAVKFIQATASATRLWAGTQAALNVVLSANPIGLVIIAVAGLVAGLVIAYKRSETFRDIVNGAFSAVKRVAGGVLSWLGTAVKTTINFVRSNWQTLVAILGGPLLAGAALVKTHWGTIKGYFSAGVTWAKSTFKAAWSVVSSILTAPVRGGRDLVNALLGSGKGGLRTYFTGVTSWATNTFKAAWSVVKSFITNPVSSARDAVRTVLGAGKGGLQSIFTSAVGALGRIWGGLKELAKSPIRFIVQTVLENGLLAAFRYVSDKVGYDAGKNLHVSLPKGFATGGILPGYTPGRDVHRFISPTGGVLDLSGGEPIMRPEFGRVVGPGWVDEANRAARRGGVGGVRRFLGQHQAFASGGRFKPTRSGRTNASYSGHTGIDFYGVTGDPIFAAAPGRISYAGAGRGYGNAVFERDGSGLEMVYGHMSRILAKVGQVVRAGQLIGRVGYSGNVRPKGPGGAHLHYEVAPGGFARASNRAASYSYLGGAALASANAPGADTGFDVLGMLKDRLAGPLGKLKELGSNPFAQMAARVPLLIKDALVGKAKGFVGNLVGNVAGKVSGVLGKAKILSVLTTALAMNRLPLSLLDNWYRQAMSESGGNAGITQQISDVNSRSGNRAQGLLQVIPPTFAAYRSKFLPNDPFNALANAFAAMNYAKNRYGNLEAVIGYGHGYANGTSSATRGLHQVGEREPELVLSRATRYFDGGESVIPLSQMSQQGMSNTFHVSTADPELAAQRVVARLENALTVTALAYT